MDTVERDIFGSQEIAYECLADTERTLNFHEAIKEVVNKGDRVIELGTGTGILSLFAAQAGAGLVHAFEIVKPMADIARQNIRSNDLQNIISVFDGDVTAAKIKENSYYDLLIAEMISVGLIEEQLVPAFNNMLKQGILKNSAKAMPCANKTYVELVDTDYVHFGVVLKTIQIEQTWQESKIKHKLTDPVLISHIDFNAAIRAQRQVEPIVDEVVAFKINQSGKVNGLRLMSDSILSDSVVSGWTQCMNSPAIIPVEPFNVIKDEIVRMRIKYEMGGEMKSLKIERL